MKDPETFENNCSFFSETLLEWYGLNKRDLPWRESKDPYIIWLSEIILQQTRVEQGLPYFLRFVDRYPDVLSLANADEDEVLKLWQGLGYYSRARNLHQAAKQIRDDYEGIFPDRYEDVLSLKGVGAYTAAAIMSFGYRKHYAAVDGNVYRVLARIFGIDDFIDTSRGQKIFQELASKLQSRAYPDLHNQAMMDFGALQCTPASPSCIECPFKDKCFAFNSGEVGALPKKRGKVLVKDRFFNYLDICAKGHRHLRKREYKDIWKGLYEFPLIETNTNISFDELVKMRDFKDLMDESSRFDLEFTHSCKHVLSHQVIHANFYRIKTEIFENENFEDIPIDSIDEYAVPKMIENYLKKLH